MYVARFSYNIKPVDRDAAMELLGREVAAAVEQGHAARLLVPLTRSPGGAALQVEIEFDSLDAFDRYRDEGMGSEDETRTWMRELSNILLEPPAVELLRSDDGPQAQGDQQSTERRKGLIGGTSHRAWASAGRGAAVPPIDGYRWP